MKLGKPEVKPALLEAINQITTAHSMSFAMRDEVKSTTFSILGIDPDSLGEVTKGAKAGTKIADKLLNACFSELKKDGLTYSPLRNRYALTDAGLQHVSQNGTPVAVTAAPVTAPEPVSAPVATPEPAVVAPEPVQAPEPVTAAPVVKVPVKVPVVKVEADTMDDYIMGLVVQNSPCFGVSPSSRAKTCKGCPVFNQCVTARNQRLIELAASLQEQADRMETVVVIEEPAMPEAPAALESSLPEHSERVPIEVSDVLCEHCHGAIEIGTEGVIVRDLGMFHLDCASKAWELHQQQQQQQAAGGA